MCCTYLIPHSLSSSMTYVSSLLKILQRLKRKKKSLFCLLGSQQSKKHKDNVVQVVPYPVRQNKSLPRKVWRRNRACLFWSDTKLSLECGPVSPAVRPGADDHSLGKHKDILLCFLCLSHNWLNTFADYVAYLSLYVSINILCTWKCPCGPVLVETIDWQAKLHILPWIPPMSPGLFNGCTRNPESHLSLFKKKKKNENWFPSFTVISAQRLCGQEMCLPCQWFWATIHNAGWFSNRQPFWGGLNGPLCLSF